jgi:hypothetical protein
LTRLLGARIDIEKILKPQEETEIRINFEASTNVDDPFAEFKMRLINPVNEKEFGDKLSALVVLDLAEDVIKNRGTRRLG